MSIVVDKNSFEKIEEIWGIGPNTLQIETKDNKVIRIHALHNIKAGINDEYYVFYEELTELEINGKKREIWAKASYSWQTGDSVKDCLEKALQMVETEDK